MGVELQLWTRVVLLELSAASCWQFQLLFFDSSSDSSALEVKCLALKVGVDHRACQNQILESTNIRGQTVSESTMSKQEIQKSRCCCFCTAFLNFGFLGAFRLGTLSRTIGW